MIPNKIAIQGYDWKIVVQKNLIDESGRNLLGLCDPEDKQIFILKTDKNTMFRTLVHEVVHAIMEQSGLHQVHDWNWNYEEIMAEQLQNFLTSDAVRFSFKKSRDEDE